MAEQNGKEHWLLQIYRWAVLIGLSIIGAMTVRVLDRIDKTADLATFLSGRVDVQAERLSGLEQRVTNHDGRIYEIERRVWRLTPERTP